MPDLINSLFPLVLALIGSAGFWSIMQNRENTRNQYQNTLKDQVENLADKLDSHSRDKEILLREIASLRAELSAAQVTIKHLEELLRQR